MKSCPDERCARGRKDPGSPARTPHERPGRGGGGWGLACLVNLCGQCFLRLQGGGQFSPFAAASLSPLRGRCLRQQTEGVAALQKDTTSHTSGQSVTPLCPLPGASPPQGGEELVPHRQSGENTAPESLFPCSPPEAKAAAFSPRQGLSASPPLKGRGTERPCRKAEASLRSRGSPSAAYLM